MRNRIRSVFFLQESDKRGAPRECKLGREVGSKRKGKGQPVRWENLKEKASPTSGSLRGIQSRCESEESEQE
jgi:hypothetical protein